MNASFLNSKTLSQILGAAIIPVSPLSPSFSVTHHQSADLVCHMENASPATRRRLNSPRSPRRSNGLLQSDITAHKKELTMKLREKVPLRRPSLVQPSSPSAPSSISSTQPCQSPLLTKKTPHGESPLQEYRRQMNILNQHLVEAEERNNWAKQIKFSTNFQHKVDTEDYFKDKFFLARNRIARWQNRVQEIAKLPTAEIRINCQLQLEKLESLAEYERQTVAFTQCTSEDYQTKKEIFFGLCELLSAIEKLRA